MFYCCGKWNYFREIYKHLRETKGHGNVKKESNDENLKMVDLYFCRWCKYEVQYWSSHIKSKHHLIQSFQIHTTLEDHKKVFCFPCARYLSPDREYIKNHSETKERFYCVKRQVLIQNVFLRLHQLLVVNGVIKFK